MPCLKQLLTVADLSFNPHHRKTDANKKRKKEKEALDLPKIAEPGSGYEPRSS